jgi:hypothetical protein
LTSGNLVKGGNVNVDTDKLEERAAVILGQIQASVAEYVRTMNEAGALRRREADEAYRQQDQVIAVLRSLETQCKTMVRAQGELSAAVGNQWLAMVERGFNKVAIDQAREAGIRTVTTFESALLDLRTEVKHALESTRKLVDENRRICRATTWKTAVVSAVWVVAVATILSLAFAK